MLPSAVVMGDIIIRVHGDAEWCHLVLDISAITQIAAECDAQAQPL